MIFRDSIDKELYDSFVSEHEKSHFMQSAAWGEFNEIERKINPHYVGMQDESGNLVAAALLLERKPPLLPPYFYSPRGFVIDFFDAILLDNFTKAVVRYCKMKGAMFLKIDPDIELRAIDTTGAPISGGFNNEELVERLKNAGFSHLGFNLGFEHRQPRYTFRIDLNCSEQAILERLEGNVIKNARKGEANYDTEIYIGGSEDIHELFKLISQTSKRDKFFAFPEKYYQNFYNVLNNYGMVTLYLGRTFTEKTIQKLKKQLEVLRLRKTGYAKKQRIIQAEQTERRLEKEISLFQDYSKKYGKQKITSAHMVVRYGCHAWAVHAGSADDMKETFLNNRVYLHKILDQKKKGAVWFDLFGAVGNPKDNQLGSLHEFKKQFGGRYIEFIGEFDMIIRPFWYNVYVKALPKYRSLLFDIRGLLRKQKN